MTTALTELRLRTRVHPDTVAAQVGKHLADTDYGVVLTGPAKVLKPDGRPLAVYLPGALRPTLDQHPDLETILYALRIQTDNRGPASGSRRLTAEGQTRGRTRRVNSAVVGAVDPMGTQKYCRLTRWTGLHLPEYARLSLLLKEMAVEFAAHVPDRYAAQAARADATEPDWVVAGTPFTTVTVNNTYATGVHKDAGDLAEGFSCLAVLRRGHYDGGRLVFPEWRVAVDMHHGDLLLMDAHDWHGNTRITCPHGGAEYAVTGCVHCKGERVSLVAYYREAIAACGTAEQERQRATLAAERRSRQT